MGRFDGSTPPIAIIVAPLARPARAAGGRLDLAFDRGEQVVDVIALEQPLAERGQRRLAIGGRIVELVVPAMGQLLELTLVLAALAVDGRTCRLEPRTQRLPDGAGYSTTLTANGITWHGHTSG